MTTIIIIQDDTTTSQVPQNALSSHITNLNNDLNRISKSLGDTELSDDKDGSIIKQSDLGKRLIHQLQTFKNMGMPKENGTSEKDGSSNDEATNGTVDESAKNVSNIILLYI